MDDAGSVDSKQSQAPADAKPFIDTAVLAAKRRAFDSPTQANLDALIEAAQASGRAETEAILNNPQKWMQWCDHRVLERCEAAEARIEQLDGELDAANQHVKIVDGSVQCIGAKNVELRDRVRVLEKAVGDCFMMAKRQIAAHLNGKSTPVQDLERWQHVQRFCETTGSKSDILRGQLPTEITDGSEATVERGRAEGRAAWQPIVSAPKDIAVLTARGSGLLAVAMYIPDPAMRRRMIWCCTDGCELLNVTHWMPLPSAPAAEPQP